ncbi:MAG: aminoacyl-tRNA hydrolase, partial [Candidatus Omnitrophica bacterium]|nr:aminoacyl-tRNA hydrolase [Candidatus Omnitrophota bacterium]
KVIIGLGNPGNEYTKTRHNIGRVLVKHIAESFALRFSKKRRLQASVVSLEWEEHPVLLAYPETWMNLSGQAVKLLIRHFKVNPTENLLVVMDDAALPFGRLRLRPKGSDGGHKGLRSIQEVLETQDYPRLRIGIGQPNGQGGEGKPHDLSMTDYVLGCLDPAELQMLPKVLDQGMEACRLWVTRSITAAMDVVNSTCKRV